MTIAVAWIRKAKETEELFFCSDSRLSGGQRWDECPKLNILPGEYAVMGFAGDAGYAYPMISSIKQALDNYPRVKRRRGMDIKHLSGTVRSMLDGLRGSVYDIADPNYQPDLEFLIGGYSPLLESFQMYRLHYVSGSKTIEKNPTIRKCGKNKLCGYIAIGDKKKEFGEALKALLIKKYGKEYYKKSFNFDYEPFEVICEMLKNNNVADSIGGAPQLAKCYKYMYAAPVGVYWPNKDPNDDFKNRTMLGRRMFDGEFSDSIFIDPATNATYHCNPSKETYQKAEEDD